MNDLERFKATCAHEPHDGILYYTSFTQDLKQRVLKHFDVRNERDLIHKTGMMDKAGLVLTPPADVPKPDLSGYYEGVEQPEGSTIDGFGVLRTPAGFHHFTHTVSPLRNAQRFEDLEAFPFPDYSRADTTRFAEIADTAHREGRVVVGHVGHIFETAWAIRGMEEFLMDMAVQPEWCEFILDKLKEINLIKARACAAAGADWIHTGDDVATQRGMMFSIEQWRRFQKPRWAEIYAEARRIKPDIQIWYHSDGDISEIIPELIEIGVTILNPVQPECLDPEMVKRLYGDKLVLDGTIGTQTTMPFGTPDVVREVVKRRIETLGYDGALILSPTHVLEPEVPLENIEAFLKTAREEGSRQTV